MKNRTLTWLLIAVAVLAPLVAAGCSSAKSAGARASANATAQADVHAAEAKATKVINACAPQLSSSVQPQATGLKTLEQPAAIQALAHHSSRKAFEGCLKSHGVQVSSSCVLSRAMSTPGGLTARAQAVYAYCLLPAVHP